jgi:hypothetical protein
MFRGSRRDLDPGGSRLWAAEYLLHRTAAISLRYCGVGVCHIAAALQRFSSPTGTGNGRLQYKGNAEQAADEIGTKEPLTRAGREQRSG